MKALIIIFLSLVIPSLYYNIKKDIKMEKSLPIVLFSIVLFIYIGGMVKKLELSVYAVLIISFIYLILCFVEFFKLKDKKRVLVNVFSPGFVLWIIMFAFVYLYHRGRMLIEWDEFSHWGDVVKAMFSINDFSTSKESLSAFQSYLPAMSIFQYYFQIINGSFKECLLFFSYDIFSLTLIISFLDNFNFTKKKILLMLLFLFIIIFSPMLFFNNFYTSIMIDAFLSIVFAYVIISICFNNNYSKFDLINISFSLMILTLTKDIGILFSAIALLIVIIDILFVKNKFSFNLKKIFKLLKPVYLFCFSILFVYILWKLNIYINDASTAFSNPINFKELLNVIIGNDSSYKTNVLSNYVTALSENSIIDNNLKLNIYAVFGLLLLIIISVYTCVDNNKRTFKICFGIMFLGNIFYVILMVVLYMFKFSEYEALNLASYSRYMSIYLNSIFIASVLTLLNNSSSNKINIVTIKMCIIVLLFVPFNRFFSGYNEINNTIIASYSYNQSATNIKNLLGNKKKKIYFVVQNDNGYIYWRLKFACRENLKGINVGYETQSWSLGEPYYDGDIWTLNLSSDNWLNLLLDNDFEYVYLYKIDDIFKNKYNNLFDNSEEIEDNRLYIVNKTQKKLVLCKEDNNE